MFRFARLYRLKTFQLGSACSCRPCSQQIVNSEAVDYALRTTKEVLTRKVSSFYRVKLQTGSHLHAGRALSEIFMDVELGDDTPLLVRDLSPSLLKCVEAVLEGDQPEEAQSAAVISLKRGLSQLTDPRGERGLSDGALKVLDNATNMLEFDANVQLVAGLLQPLMEGFCVFNMGHQKALEKIQGHNNDMFLPPSVHWEGLAQGNPISWYGELDMLICPFLQITAPESTYFPVAVVPKGKESLPELSDDEEDKQAIKEMFSLLGTNTEYSKGYAAAIMFSFLCHYKFGMKSSFIPSLLLAPEGFAVFFYDCKEDMMISKACRWTEYSLVLLWSILHYRLFYPPTVAMEADKTPPFGYIGSVRPDLRYLGEEQFYFGESLNSPVFAKAHPFAGRLEDDVRRPDKGLKIKLMADSEKKD